uniref:Uncharacterized protein n=1 Tax=Aureoumbra lagunensis TaxID=44058 RepID=A0A7S3NDJ9_9STRA|mmetsp:Transcript_21997/g.33951  ORF Transcript_21997/g.33951 Transcript_21997/m.33951 type:complete len:242 (-) Transcript_21997:39-764(-)
MLTIVTFAAAVCGLLIPLVGICILLNSRAQLMLIAVISGFIWFISVTIIALFFVLLEAKILTLWALLTALLQECARLGSVLLYRKLTDMVAGSYNDFNDTSTALAAGIGYAATHSVAIFGSGSTECPVAAAMLALCFQLLDLILFRLAFLAIPVRERIDPISKKSTLLTCIVIASHLLATAGTIAIPCKTSSCVASVPLPFLALALASATLYLNLKEVRSLHHFRTLDSPHPPTAAELDDE